MAKTVTDDSVTSTEEVAFSSMPGPVGFAMKVARRWQNVPDTMSDDDALAQGIITPEMIEMIMAIAMSMMQDCFGNQKSAAWKRVRAYTQAVKPMDRIGDNTAFNWLIDRWLVRMGVPRDRGDILGIRQAFVQTTSELDEKKFNELQAMMLFLTV